VRLAVTYAHHLSPLVLILPRRMRCGLLPVYCTKVIIIQSAIFMLNSAIDYLTMHSLCGVE
jgi:hypothetical protein